MHATREFRPQPRLRRVFDAVKNMAAEIKPTEGGYFAWRESLIRGQQRVAEHYRHVLAKHQLSQGERDDIMNRIARIEAELDRLTRVGDSPRPSPSFAFSLENGKSGVAPPSSSRTIGVPNAFPSNAN